MAETPHQQRKMHRTAFACLGIVVGMVGLAYASVPLYDLFCKVTGFDGTPVARDSNDTQVVDRKIAVRFDANVAPGLSWRFSADVRGGCARRRCMPCCGSNERGFRSSACGRG